MSNSKIRPLDITDEKKVTNITAVEKPQDSSSEEEETVGSSNKIEVSFGK